MVSFKILNFYFDMTKVKEMAFYSCVNRSISMSSLRNLANKVNLQPTFYFSKYQTFDDEKEGVLDDFTSQLMQRKSSKWESQKMYAQKKIKDNKLVSRIMETPSQIRHEHDIHLLNINEINLLFQQAIHVDDILTIVGLIKQCVKYDKIPSLMILLKVLSLCSQNGDKDTIVKVAQLCEKLRPEILHENSYFEHYIAEAIWVKGNIIKSLEIFEKVYRENVYLRRRIRCILKYLILDIVTSHSEATLINIIKFSEMVLNEYGDSFPLACIWHSCFLSEWFTDQQLALELLERNSDLVNTIVGRIPYVVRVSLRFDRTEVVYRLTEMLLRFHLESELIHVLLALADYWIRKGDLRQCNEVIKWSARNNIVLPTLIKNTKVLKMFKEGSDTKPESKPSVPKRPQTEYKF